MPESIGRFLADEFFTDPVFRLSKTTRPYFLQSRTLFLVCRRLPEPPSDAAAQIRDLHELFKEVEHVLYLGTKAPRDHQTEINEAFRAADEHLRDYIVKYNVTLALAPDTDEVKGQVIQPLKKVSKKAGSWIKKHKVLAGAKHMNNLTVNVSLWWEIPRKRENGQWLYTSSNLDVEIEKFASLNVLLHKLFWGMAIDNCLPSFSLKQSPQFYTEFPHKKDHFPMPIQVPNLNSDVHPCIPALWGWDSVAKYEGGTLHLIVDRHRSDREIVLEDLTKLHLPGIYGNGWHLDGEKNLIAVREKGGSHNLVLWNVKQPPVLSVTDSSTVTLVEAPGLTPGLNMEELDKESTQGQTIHGTTSNLFTSNSQPSSTEVESPGASVPVAFANVGDLSTTTLVEDLQTPDICLEVLDEEVESLAAFTGNVLGPTIYVRPSISTPPATSMPVPQLAAAPTTFDQVTPQVCGVLPHTVADSGISTPIEASVHSNASTVHLDPQPRGTSSIPDQGTTTGVGQDSRLALPPRLQHALPQPLLDTLDPIEGYHLEGASSSADQNIAQPIVNRSSVEDSERNIATGSQHGNRTPSMRDLPEPSKEKAVPRDKAEDATHTPTLSRQAIEELLVLLRARELRENGVQGNFHSSPQYGAGYFAQPYSNSDAAHISTITPEYKMFATHHHYHYNAPNVSPRPSIST